MWWIYFQSSCNLSNQSRPNAYLIPFVNISNMLVLYVHHLPAPSSPCIGRASIVKLSLQFVSILFVVHVGVQLDMSVCPQILLSLMKSTRQHELIRQVVNLPIGNKTIRRKKVKKS